MTLLESYNQRKGAETGKPASASAQTKPAANRPRTLLESYQARRTADTARPVYSAAQPQASVQKPRTLLESWQQRNLYTPQAKQTEPQGLYARALGGNAAKEQKSPYSSTLYADSAAEKKENRSFSIFDLIGRGQDQALTAEEGRGLIRTGAAAIKKPEINQWSGRQELVDEYKKLEREEQAARMAIASGGRLPDGYLEATGRRLNEVRQTLEKGDEAAGNGPMSYSGQSRAANILAGAGQNIASSLASAAGTFGEQYGRAIREEEARNMEQLLAPAEVFGRRDLTDRARKSAEEVRAAENASAHAKWQTVTGAADRLGEGAAKDLEAAKGGLTKLGQAGVDIAENLIEMGFDAAVGAATGGNSLVPMFARTFGSAAQEARRDGATLDEQVLYGTVKGGIEVLTEKMFDGVAKIYGEGAADELVERAIGKLAKSDSGRTFLRLLSNSTGEGVEELVSGLLDPLASAIYKDINLNPLDFRNGYWSNIDPAELLYSMLIGAAIGSLGGVTSIVNGQNTAANARLRAMEAVEPTVNAIMSDPARLAEYARQYQADTGEALPTGERAMRNAVMEREAEALLAARETTAQTNENAARGRAAADMEGVIENAEQSFDRGSEDGYADLRPGGEDLNNEGGARVVAVDAGDEGGAAADRVQNYGVKEEVTPAALGVTNGSTEQTVQVLDESTFQEGSQEAQAAQRARQNGLEPVFIKGTMQIGDKRARAYIKGNQVILQADGRIDADQLLDHELYHREVKKNPRLNAMLRQALANNMSEQELGALVSRYITMYDGVYDFSGMTPAQITAICEEELFADLYAGIDNFNLQAQRETARQTVNEVQQSGINAEARQDTTGPPEGRASYAGRNARTADSNTLRQAEQMERDGRSGEEIRQETGWFRGSDGQWRFEVNDSGAKYYRNGDARFRNDHPEYARYQDLMNRFLTGNLNTDELVELQQLEQTWGREQARLKDLTDRGNATLDMLLDHSALFEAYPELRDAKVRFADLAGGEKGSYDPKSNTITIANELRSAPESTLIHEIQHAIQAAEGFSGGASVEYWMDQGYSREEAERRYRATAGEIEARDAAARRTMTEEERKKTSPDLGDENTVLAEGDYTFSADLSGSGDKVTHGLVIDAIRKHFQEVKNDEVVKTITGNEFQKTVNDTRSLKAKIKEFFDSIGNKVTREGFGDIALNNAGVRDSLEHGYGKLKAATFAALPDVLQKGKLYNADPNHTLHPYDSYLIIAPINIGTGENSERYCIGAIVMRDANTQRYKIHEVLAERENGTSSDKSEAHQIGSGLRYDAPSNNTIRSSSQNVNPQSEGQASVEVGGEENLADTQDAGSKESRESNNALADELADGKAWESVERGKAIEINPGEGEEAVSSTIGLTEEDNRRIDRTFPASDLFGPTNAQKEAAAMKTAVNDGNAALREFAEQMPEDPMDLYGDQNPVTSRKESGDGSRNTPGRGKISAAKEAERKTLGQKASEGWHRFLRSMVNEGDAVHQIGRKTGNRAIDGMYFYAKAATMRAQQWIQKQRTSFDTRTTGKSLNDIFDPIRAKGDGYYEKFQLYLYHRLNVERMSRSAADAIRVAQETVSRLAAVNPDIAAMTDETLAAKARQYQEGGGLGFDEENSELIYEYWQAKQELRRAEKARNKPIFDYEVDAEQSEKSARDLLAANPEFDELAQEVYDYCDALLQYRVDAGLITAEDMAKLKSTYPHYVPVMYEMAEEAADKVHKGNVSVSTTVKSAKGGTTKLLPLHYALARQTLAVMRNAGYQQLGSAVLSEYEQNREIMDRYVSDVAENDAVWDESMADNDDVNVPYENVIGIFRDGKRYDITLSEDLSYAFQSLQGKNGPQDLKMAMSANNLFKKLCTAYNPLFMITNPIRDVQDALFYSTDTKRWMKNYPKAIAQIAGSGKYWQMYQSLGGVQNSYFDWATGEAAGKMGKVEALNMAIEQAPRLAEFMTVLENAQRDHSKIAQDDLMEAFNAAAEITTNFSRGGTMGKWINRNLVPFWNPGVQGLSKAVRTVTETKGLKAWAGLALKAAALGMLPELLNGLLYRDDDEWDVIDDQMKMDYYLFKTTDGVWIKVPKGRMLAALSMPVVGAQESMRGDDVDWSGLAKSAFGSVAPNNPFETNLLSTALQAKLTNPDDPGKTWYGGNIESKRLQNYAPGERYDESTDAISKWLGGKLGISPKKLNYVIDQYSGILGDLILPYLTPKAERGLYVGGVAVPLSNAFMSRFTMDTVTSNTISNEYYGLLDELGYAAKDGDKPSAVAERYLNRAGGMVSDFYARIREIENDETLSDAEKSKLTRELRKQLNEYEQQITADAGEYLQTAQSYLDDHPEFDYTDDRSVDAFVDGYNSLQTDQKYFIDADRARDMMKDEVYREINREHFGAAYALQVYNKDVFRKAQELNADCGLTYEDYYDFYFSKRYLYADKDEDGKSISGSKKEKIVALINGMDIPDEQKDALYIASGYTEKSLKTTPWRGGNGKYTSRQGGGRGRSRKSRSTRTSVKKITGGNASTSRRRVASGIDISTLFSGQTGQTGQTTAPRKRQTGNADASRKLLQIVNQFYGGDEWAAAMDGGRKARTKVDFRL